MDHPAPHPAARAAVIAAVLALFAGAGILITEKAYRWMHRGGKVAERLEGDLETVLHFRPRMTVNETTLVTESRNIEELAVVQKAFEHTLDWKQTYMGSTKEIELKGSFVVKAGYDLAQPFSVDVSTDGQSIRVTRPAAKILSLEQVRFQVLKDENGWWNTISPQDREDAMNALLAGARSSLNQTGLLRDTDKALSDLLEHQFRKESPQSAIEIDGPRQ